MSKTYYQTIENIVITAQQYPDSFRHDLGAVVSVNVRER